MANKIMKEIIQDHHFKYDETTRVITFVKSDYVYKDEKIVFASQGIDIDQIQTVDEYDRLRMQYRYALMARFEQKWQKVKPKTLEEKYTKSLMLNDIDHQISEFINLISESKHKRALLDKLENLEEERILID